MVRTTKLATPRFLWLIMAKASALDAHYAAAAHLVADLNPNPPILIGRVAISRAKFCSSTSPGTCCRHGGSVRIVWLTRELALCNNNCHAH